MAMNILNMVRNKIVKTTNLLGFKKKKRKKKKKKKKRNIKKKIMMKKMNSR